MGGLDFVSREEFDAVKAMAAKAREEGRGAEGRIEALEAKSADPGKAAPKPCPFAPPPSSAPSARMAKRRRSCAC
jgi:BMFP domain-containing protein YqiC